MRTPSTHPRSPAAQHRRCLPIPRPTTSVTGAATSGTGGAATSVTGAATSGTGGAAASVTGAAVSATGAPPRRSPGRPYPEQGAATTSVAGAAVFGTAVTRSESFFSSVVFVPLGSFVGVSAPVEGCWPEPSELFSPSVAVRAVSAASPAGLLAPVLLCSDALVSPWVGAAEMLELGSAKATVPPAPPTNKPASRQTPAAKRKFAGTTVCSPQHQGPLANRPKSATVSHMARASDIRFAK